jgi:dienelactone hydrolase
MRSAALGRLAPALWVLFVAAACDGGPGLSAPAAEGRLSVEPCVIAAQASSCQGVIAWTTMNATAPRVEVAGTTLSSAPAGRETLAFGPATLGVVLFDGTQKLDDASIRADCVSASAWEDGQCRVYARRRDERVPTPFVEEGQAVTLEAVVFEPLGPGPHPAVLFHHGSTGQGDDPSLFTLTYTSEVIAKFFVDRGFLVAFPQRRGRGKSGGRYDEGFTPDRSRYSCLQDAALAGFEHALLDVDAALAWLRERPGVDASVLLSAGISRGGILALVHAAQHPASFAGAVNFVGGWLGEGCVDAVPVNRSLAVRAAAFPDPTLWLYGENDPFYSLAHSRGNFNAFVGAGGRGSYKSYTRAPGLSGHLIINDPQLWAADLGDYVRDVAR